MSRRHGIVAGVDDSAAGRAAVLFAAAEAKRTNMELVLLHAWTVAPLGSSADVEHSATRARGAGDTLGSESVALARRAGDGLLVRNITVGD